MDGAQLTIYFWDVGQGDCSTIKLPDGSFLIIDCGTRGSPLIDWCTGPIGRNAKIHGIVLTHNDADHAGALPSIVAQKKSDIGGIWMLVDSDSKAERFQKIFRAAYQGEEEGYYEVKRAEKGTVIWSDADQDIHIKIIHPKFSQNLKSKNPNDTSAAIILEASGNTLAAWPGDLRMARTAEILSSHEPELVVGPHHGGPSDVLSKADRKKLTPEKIRERNENYVTSVNQLSPGVSWISVGTNNQHNHPRQRHLDALAQTGCRVVCSQITNLCDRASPRDKKPVFKGSAALGLPVPRTGVSCRGTMCMYVKDGKLCFDSLAGKHLEKVTKLHRPRCLRARGWKTGEEIPEDFFRF